MKNPFIQMAAMAALMASAFHENQLRDWRGPASRRYRRGGRTQERGIVPKAFRQYSKRYGAGVQSLKSEHAKYRKTPTLDQAKRQIRPRIFSEAA